MRTDCISFVWLPAMSTISTKASHLLFFLNALLFHDPHKPSKHRHHNCGSGYCGICFDAAPPGFRMWFTESSVHLVIHENMFFCAAVQINPVKNTMGDCVTLT